MPTVVKAPKLAKIPIINVSYGQSADSQCLWWPKHPAMRKYSYNMLLFHQLDKSYPLHMFWFQSASACTKTEKDLKEMKGGKIVTARDEKHKSLPIYMVIFSENQLDRSLMLETISDRTDKWTRSSPRQ